MDDNLKSRAEGLGIKVDGRWSDERIQQEIDAAIATADTAPPEPGSTKAATSRKVPVRLLYDVWLVEDVRTPAGSVINMDIDAARKVLAEGKAERADPLPGEPA